MRLQLSGPGSDGRRLRHGGPARGVEIPQRSFNLLAFRFQALVRGFDAGLGLGQLSSEIALRLCSAAFIGALLGLNRELRGKPAGLRTNSLVSLGAALLTLASIGVATGKDGVPDPAAVSRAMQGIITGIGFLGAGVILRDVGGTRVHGITTATTIWLVAALGILCGAGIWPVAIVGLGLTLVILVLGRPLEGFLHRRFPKLAEDPHEPPH